MTRAETLARVEAIAWLSLRAAHNNLAQHAPADCDYYRAAVREAENRWRRAITDLDRAQSRPVEQDAA